MESMKIVLICFAHGSAIGPFDDVDAAWAFLSAAKAESTIDCRFEALPMLQPEIERAEVTYDTRGYL